MNWKDGLLCGIVVGLALACALPSTAAEPTSAPLPRLEIGMHTAPIRRIATDLAGRWAVTASHDKTARVWDVASGKQVMVLRPPQDAGNEGKLYAVAMSPDGAWVAVGGWTGAAWNQNTTSIYVFDRASGRLLQRVAGLPNVILHLAWSPDGHWLAATFFGKNGLRIYNAVSGDESGRDADYGADAYSAHFSPDGSRLVTTCYDGQIRLYALEAGKPRRLAAVHLTGGKDPFAARFSPDGRAIAVGFNDSTAVQVLDAASLAETARPSVIGIGNGNLGSVDWSADGRRLLAAGRWDVAGKSPVRSWSVDDWQRYRDQPLVNGTTMDLVPLPDGNLLFAGTDPNWGVLDPDGQVVRRSDGELADLRGQRDQLRISADGRRVRFGYRAWGKDARVFDLAQRTLADDDPGLAPARTTGLEIANWKNQTNPNLAGRPLALDPYETSRSLAIAADGRHFALGTEWALRLYDRDGQEQWRQAVPSTVWAVNLSADGRYVVAGYGDGTIRWHRFKDGQEILAFFPHADQKRWIAWTPEGYFDASPGAEDMMGYHLNQGADKEGQFVSARQLRETFYQPDLIARRLDADGDALLEAMVAKRGDVRQLLAAGKPPELELLSPAQTQSGGEFKLRFKLTQPGAGQGKLVIRVDGQEIAARRAGPALVAGGVTEVPLELADGRHEVSAELVDKRGIASPPVRASVNVSRPAGAEAATLHVLAVGISDYRDGDLRLKHAAADAAAIAARLQQRGAPLFGGRVIVRTLLNRDGTREKIGKTLAEMAARARPEDTFVVFLAGHGTTADDEYHFMPWELEYENDAALRRQAISQTLLRDWLKQLPTRSLLLLDTCRAGNMAQLASRASEDKNALAKLITISQRNVIAASSATQIALEGYQGHGVFSWVVLDALLHADYDDNGHVDVSDITMHVRKHVPEITERVFKYRQVPMQDTPGDPFAVAVPEAKTP